jgi:polysaccharide biosynthesis protein PslH
MKIGFISDMLPYLPCAGGFRLYGGNLIRQLAKNHTIDLISLCVGNDAEHFDWAKQHCRTVVGVPDTHSPWLTPFSVMSGYLFGRPLRHRTEVLNALHELSWQWDVIHAEGSYLAALLPPSLSTPKVLSVHDAEVLRIKEMLRCKLSLSQQCYFRMRSVIEPRYDRLVYPRFDRVVVVAERDRAVVRELLGKDMVELIPYGTDTEYFHPVDVQKEPETIVFHGHLGYPPNIDAALELVQQIFPLVQKEIPTSTVHLIGASPDARIQQLAQQPGVRLSANLADLRSAVCSAQVYACAIRYGTGLKSKVLEAMAMNMPIVGYPGSTVGISCTHGETVMVAQTPEEFAAHVVALLRNPPGALRIAQAARRLVELQYSWQSRAAVYENLYARLIAHRKQALAVC